MVGPAVQKRPSDLRGTTLIELLVVIPLIAILAGIILGVYSTATARARERVCMNNLRQVYLALQMYREDHAGTPPAMLAELVPTYATRDVLLCVADPYGGWRNARLESVAPDLGGEGAVLWATAKLDPDVPTSYLYAAAHFAPGWWPRLAAEEDTACVACWVHGKPYPGTGGPGPPWYTGRTVRLRFDGSVTVDEVVAVYHPTPEFLAEFPNTGLGVKWRPFFDPNETWED